MSLVTPYEKEMAKRTKVLADIMDAMNLSNITSENMERIQKNIYAFNNPSTLFQITDIGRISDILRKNIYDEVEVRFGNIIHKGYNNIFISGVDFTRFMFLKNYLDSLTVTSKTFHRFISRDTIEISNNKLQSNIRKISNIHQELPEFQLKKPIVTIDSNKYGVRFQQSIEKFISPPDGDFIIDIIRHRNRFSYVESNINAELYGYSIDLTVVYQTKNGKKRNICEIEIERVYQKSIKYIHTIEQLLHIVDVLYKNQSPTKLYITTILNTNLTNWFNLSFEFKYGDPLYLTGSKNLNKPVSLHMYDMIEASFDPCITVKYDGLRTLLAIIRKYAILIFYPNNIVYITYDESFSNEASLFDCELVKTDLYLFDCLYHTGDDLRNESFLTRYLSVEQFSRENSSVGNLNVYPKKYYYEESFYDNVKNAFNSFEYTTVDNDGLILQSRSKYQSKVYKWKPLHLITIDFLLIGDGELNCFTTDRGAIIPINGVKVVGNIIDGIIPSGLVVECKVVSENITDDPLLFEMFRIRWDKEYPNSANTIDNILQSIRRPIYEQTIKGLDLKVARVYHNQEKRMKIKHIKKDSTILDIGSGRGGDIGKWIGANIKKVYAIEPNEENLSILIERLHDVNHDICEIIQLHAKFEELHIEYIPDKIDVITTYFSSTFFFKNIDIYTKYLKNIDKFLKYDGKLSGIVIDGDRIKKLLDSNRIKYNIDENMTSYFWSTAFSIEQVTEFDGSEGDEILININDPDSMVKNQIEWLFYFDKFSIDMENMGFIRSNVSYLDRGIQFDKLSDDAKIFSSLFVSYEFTRKIYEIYVAPVIIDDKYKYINNKANVIYSLLCAVIYAIIHEELDDKQLLHIRSAISQTLSYEEFIQFSFCKRLINNEKNRYDEPDDLYSYVAYETFKKNLRKFVYFSRTIIGELLSYVFNIQIIIIDSEGYIENIYGDNITDICVIKEYLGTESNSTLQYSTLLDMINKNTIFDRTILNIVVKIWSKKKLI